MALVYVSEVILIAFASMAGFMLPGIIIGMPLCSCVFDN